MTRRQTHVPIRLLLMCCAVALWLLVTCCRGEVRRYNVVLITLDTFRADRIGSLTPNLRELAASGASFSEAIAPAPLTLPAHATILSGLLPLHHGVRNNGTGTFSAERQTLATTLHDKGWRTGAFVGAFVLDRRFGLTRGFEVYDDAIVRDPNDDSTSALEAQRRASVVVDSAIAWLSRNDSRPFLAWVHLYDAHAPYAPPPPFPQTYDGEIQYVDQQIGRLLAAIDRRNTILLVVGDHGEALGEHGEPTHGLLLYEATLHVPLIIAAPGVVPHTVKEAVTTADVAPTLAALAGAPMNAATDGASLAEAVRNGTEPPRERIYSETEYPVSFGWSALRALRRGDDKLIAGAAPRMFDLARDPLELTDVLPQQRRTYRELSSALQSLMSTSIARGAASVDAETRAKLQSLGYVAPSRSSGGSGRDPQEMLPLFLKFETAMTELNAGRPRDAVPLLDEITAADPANRLFRSTLGRALRALGAADRAVRLYKEAVALAPSDADTWYDLGATLQEEGKVREARVAIEEALRREPGRPEAHNTLGVIDAAEGNLDGAAAEFRAVIRIDPRNARAFNNLGNVLRAQGRAEDAAAAYRRSAELAPAYPDPLNGLAVLLVQQGRSSEAVPILDAAIRLAPAFYEARLNRAIALQMSGDAAAARRALTELLAALPPGDRFDAQRGTARAVLSQIRN